MKTVFILLVFLLFGFCAWRAALAWEHKAHLRALVWLAAGVVEWAFAGAIFIGAGLTWGGK